MSKMDERLARIEQKLDDFVGSAHAQHEESRAICEKHLAMTQDLEARTNKLESQRDKVLGGAKVAGIIGPPILAAIGIWFRKKFGGHP